MPKVVSYTPAWLSSPAPGHEIFSPTAAQNNSLQALSEAAKCKARTGPRRVIARRGTEIFVAVGKEIRWGDLAQLKEDFELREEEGSESQSTQGKPYKTFKTPVSDDIRQLIMSPNNDFMAILTTHTVHIAILPDASHLTAPDTENQQTPRLKTYTLGSVTHVTTQSAVVSALWHPLGVNGSCIVTITQDAVVRLWELSTADRWSFDKPTLAVDLRKLVDGTAIDQDFTASLTSAKKGFSPDSFEMEVAAAAFAERGCAGWAPMTLWIAMREGDVYALCPFLPEKWSPPPTLIPSLSVAIVAKVAALEGDDTASPQATQLAQQQLAWMADLDNQVPTTIDAVGTDSEIDVYTRPRKPGRVPKLQGPFEFEMAPDVSENDLDEMISDIHVIGAKFDTEDLMFGEEDDLAQEEGLSLNIICLLTSSGRLSICLDLDGVEAQWLPTSKKRHFANEDELPLLLTFQTMETLKEGEIYEQSWPMFSTDVASRYSFFVTHASGVTSISLAPWAFRLESELQQGSSNAGVDFRIDLIVKGQNSLRQRVITRHLPQGDVPTALSASVVLQDPDLGYVLLSSSPHRAVAVCFEMVGGGGEMRSRSPSYSNEDSQQPLLLCAPREVYQTSPIFTTQTQIPRLLEDLHRSRYKRLMSESVRLSPATLTILTSAHKILSEETHRLSTAAAELFRRCERLQIELKDQVGRANDVASRVETVVGADLELEDNTFAGNEGLEARIQQVNDRQRQLTDRLDKIRKKALRTGQSKDLSDKEKMWFEEVSTLEESIVSASQETKTSQSRFEEVKALTVELMAKVSSRGAGQESVDVDETQHISNQIRKQKVTQVMKLLDREEALVGGTRMRLERIMLG